MKIKVYAESGGFQSSGSICFIVNIDGYNDPLNIISVMSELLGNIPVDNDHKIVQTQVKQRDRSLHRTRNLCHESDLSANRNHRDTCQHHKAGWNQLHP